MIPIHRLKYDAKKTSNARLCSENLTMEIFQTYSNIRIHFKWLHTGNITFGSMKKNTILTLTQQQFLDWIDTQEFSRKVYWSWGTALAYQYNHRLSTDLDFFSFDFLADYELIPFIEDIKKHFWVQKVQRQNIYNRNIFLFDDSLDSLKMEFTFFPFPRNSPKELWNTTLEIDAPSEIWANKIHAITERHEVKDVYDLYYIINIGDISLDILLDRTADKFGTIFEKKDIIARINYIAQDLSYLQPFLLDQSVKIRTVQNWCTSLI